MASGARATLRVLVVEANGKPIADALVDARPHPPFLGSDMVRYLNQVRTDASGAATRRPSREDSTT
ncbi:MAG: hypothetical protein LAO51_18625 [Acidobacteriia bacterium]|nr:hypothetical protein [Terriglobia bacterium]